MKPELTPEEITHHCYITKCGLGDRCEPCIAKAQCQKIYNWGNEPCPHEHRLHTDKGKYLLFKRECPLCWEELKD